VVPVPAAGVAEGRGAVRWHAREPVSSYSHLLGVALSLPALVVLVVQSQGDPRRVVAFSVYGASLVLLYSASTIYHWLRLSPHGEDILRRIDHVAIFVLIAGSYTPVCLVTLRGGWGWGLLGVIWTLAIVGAALKIFFEHLPRRISTALYVGMGWVAVVAVVPLVEHLRAGGMTWLAVGGLFYTIGAVVYAFERPRIPSPVVDHHDVFHFFVLAGSASHFVLMMRYVLPPI
jgi:hemolysin III